MPLRLHTRHAPSATIMVLATVIVLSGMIGSGLLYRSQSTVNPNASASVDYPADINSNGVVDISDLSYLIDHWNTSDSLSDINHDGFVSISDVSVLLSNWGSVGSGITCTKTITVADTISTSLTGLVPGDVLCLHGGTYTQNVTATLPAGTTDRPITVMSYANEKPIIQGLVRLTGATNYIFDGIDITWPTSGATSSDHMLKLTNGTNWVWKNSEISGARSFAGVLVAGTVSGQPSNWRITNNCIHDTYATNGINQDHNIYVNTGTSAGNGSIDHNIIYNAPNGENIKLAGPSTGYGTANVSVTYNTLYSASQNLLVGWTSTNNTFNKNLVFGSTSNVNIRAYQLAAGTVNTVSDNYFGGSTRFIVTDSGYAGMTDAGNNVFPAADPQFDSSVCSVDGGVLSGFRPQNATAAKYGHAAN